MWGQVFVGVVLAGACVLAAPLAQDSGALANVDLSLSVFDQKSAGKADTSKNYVIFAYDVGACAGDKQAKCAQLESVLGDVAKVSDKDEFSKYRANLVFGKANKDDFPDHKKDLDNAKVPLPAVLFWPAGHSRPSCKFDTPDATPAQLSQWLMAKLKEEDDDSLLQMDEGSAEAKAALDPVSLLVCSADKSDLSHPAEDPTCGDFFEAPNQVQGLVQVEKTQKIWDFTSASSKFIGPADNSLPHNTNTNMPSTVRDVDSASYQELTKQSKWLGLYFQSSWCHYCSCLTPVWEGVSANLISTQRQPELVLGKVDGDAAPELRNLLNVTVYPTFLLINKEGNKVLGRYLGPRKVFELSNWIEDLIVGAENPVVKHQFESSEQGAQVDLHPVFPYTGPAAFGGEAKLASQSLLSTETGLMGNEFDECLESDEAKFTAPGAALLVHYSSDKHSLELDSSVVSTSKIPDKLTVIDFYASWCPHCQKLNPVWDQLSTELNANNRVVVGKVEMETHPDIKRQFGIRRFPTIMYFEAGKPMAYEEARRYTGQRDLAHLKQWIEGLQH